MAKRSRPFNRLMAIDRTTELMAIKRQRRLATSEREEFQALLENLIENERAEYWRQREGQEMPAHQESGVH